MKAFIAGIITLSILIAAVTFNGIFVCRQIQALSDETRALSSDITLANCEALTELWKSSSPFITLSVSRSSVDEIDDTITLMINDIKTGNETAYLVSRTKLICLFDRLKETESFNLRRIF